jgi:hypothetical protein
VGEPEQSDTRLLPVGKLPNWYELSFSKYT